VKNAESTKSKRKKIDLFDDNDDSNNKEDVLWNEDEFNANKPKKVAILYFATVMSYIEAAHVIYSYRLFLGMIHDLLWITVS
jgi:hypothetical protein